MNFKPDIERENRCGIPEVVYGEGKSTDDLISISKRFLEESGRVIITRIDEKKTNSILGKIKNHDSRYSKSGKVLVIKKKGFKTEKTGTVGILTAGTSDTPIAEEARIIAEELGMNVIVDYDVGVAGIHRVFPALEKMKNAGVLVVIAGMEGTLPSVVSGLTGRPVIGVPTSVGYGTGAGGQTALHTMLNSCSPVAVVNIDNGYGAAILSFKIIKNAKPQ